MPAYALPAEVLAEEIAAQQAAAALAAQQAAAAAEAAQAAQAARAAQAAEQTTTQSGIQQLLQPTTAPVAPPSTVPVETAPLPSATPPAAPPPPAPTEETLLRSQGPIDTTPRMATPGFDTAGFENPDGITTLAREVGAQSTMPGVQSTMSGYGAGAPPGSSVLPPMPVGSPPAPGIDQLVQPNLSGMGSNMPPAPPFANQTMMPPPASPPAASNFTSAPTLSYPPSGAPPVGVDPASQQAVREGMLNNYQTQQLYPNANVSENVFDPRVSPAQGLQAKDFAGNSVEGLTQRPAGTSTGLQTSTNPFTYSGSEAAPKLGYGLNSAIEPTALSANAAPESSGIRGLFNQGVDYVKKNPLTSAMLASAAYQMLNQPKPYERPKYKSTWNAGAYSGYQPVQPTPYRPNYAAGGLADLGGYSDGGRMLKGPGDGMSDDIPATIANKQPARLANEEFVIPADVVSHLGNGSSEAGAKQLYKMMDRVRQARTGNKKQGKQINPEKYLA